MQVEISQGGHDFVEKHVADILWPSTLLED